MQSIAMDAVGSSPRLREHVTHPLLCLCPVSFSVLLLREVRMLVETSFFLLTGCLSLGLSLQQIFGPLGLRQQERRNLARFGGVCLGEGSNSALESISSPQVATDLGRVAGACMSTGE